jgi:hypothetical protein
MTLEEYKKINRSFKKVCVYRIGNEAGFFSEINNMVIAMVYCLEHSLQFRLYSANSNFGDDIWKDYFNPFTIHSTSASHFLFNERPYIHKRPYRLCIEELFSIKQELSKQFLTQDIWPYLRDKSRYNYNHTVNSPDIKGTLTEVTTILIECIWKYNRSTKTKIYELVKSLEIPGSYCAFFIRRGDKDIEAAHEELHKYFDMMDSVHEGDRLPVFIGSDDYQVIEEVKNLYSDRAIYHFNFEDDKGYFMGEFLSNYSKEEQKAKIIRLLAQVEVLKNARVFVGTYSTNVSVFIGMARNCHNCYDINHLEWLLW